MEENPPAELAPHATRYLPRASLVRSPLANTYQIQLTWLHYRVSAPLEGAPGSPSPTQVCRLMRELAGQIALDGRVLDVVPEGVTLVGEGPMMRLAPPAAASPYDCLSCAGTGLVRVPDISKAQGFYTRTCRCVKGT